MTATSPTVPTDAEGWAAVARVGVLIADAVVALRQPATTTRATTPAMAYLALQRAAETLGAYTYATQRAADRRKGFRFYPTPEHREIVQAMRDVLNGDCTVEEAMALLHWGDIAEMLRSA